MRQTGILAACAAFALTHHFPLLRGVHALARTLENGLVRIGANIINRVETCMVRWLISIFYSRLFTACFPIKVFYDPSPLGLEYDEIEDRARQLPEPITLVGSRLVLHIQTSEVAVHDFLMLVQRLAEEKEKATRLPICTRMEVWLSDRITVS